MTGRMFAGLAMVTLLVAGCGQPEPENSQQSPAPTTKVLRAALKDNRGEVTLKVVARSVGPDSIEQARFDEMDGQGRYIVKMAATHIELALEGKPVEGLPADGLYDPNSVTIDRAGAQVHFRINGGDADASYFCDFFISQSRLIRRECGPAEIGEATEISTYIERTLE